LMLLPYTPAKQSGNDCSYDTLNPVGEGVPDSSQNYNTYYVEPFQTHVYIGGPPDTSTSMIWALLTCFLCCWPVSMVAMIFAAHASSDAASGNYRRAKKYVRNANITSVISAILGLIIIALFVVYLRDKI